MSMPASPGRVPTAQPVVVRDTMAAMRTTGRRLLAWLLIVATAPLTGLTAVPASVSAAPACSIASTLRQGSSSAEVSCLEGRLLALGYTLVGPDTTFGASTTLAVKAYQHDHALVSDGIVGPITRAALGLVPPLPTPPPLVGAVPAKVIETRVIGTSVQGRDITAYRMGTPGGRVVLIIGVIHGDETKGGQITKLLRTMPTPKGIDLWLIDTINPDGMAAFQRQNAHAVDLNRNFSEGWSYIPKSTENRQYSGEAPADQPETVATEQFIRDIRPKVVIWYHQDANTITLNGTNKNIPKTYAGYVGLVPGNVPCSTRCTGTASTFANRTVSGATSFIVELPSSSKVTTDMIRRHAAAVLAVVTL